MLLTYVASDGGLCAMRPDGSHPVRLTPRWRLAGPAWSPDGRFVAFGRATGPEQSKIAVADARGRARWMFGEGHSGRPLWSPDGSRIAYSWSYAHVFGLSVADRDGSDGRAIASSPPWPSYGPEDPAWSADSRRVAFDNGDGVSLPQGIYTVDIENNSGGLLIPDAREPAYSPDGSSLAAAGRAGIVIAGIDGSNPRVLPSSANGSWPAWSPDSSRITFVQNNSALVVADADGSGERVIASTAGVPPAWSPGGKLIAFVRGPRTYTGQRRVRSSIVVARADGSGSRTVVRRFAKRVVDLPAWRAPVALPLSNRPHCPTN